MRTEVWTKMRAEVCVEVLAVFSVCSVCTVRSVCSEVRADPAGAGAQMRAVSPSAKAGDFEEAGWGCAEPGVGAGGARVDARADARTCERAGAGARVARRPDAGAKTGNVVEAWS